MENKIVKLEEIIHALPSQVWEALTDIDKMKVWYFDIDQFEATVGFEFRFNGEGHDCEKYVHICVVTEVIPNKKLQYSWSYENQPGYSLVTFELVEEGEKTRLILTHEGLESFPQNNPDFAIDSFDGGWNHIIKTSLVDYFLPQKLG